MSDICFGCFKNVIAGPGPCPACGFDPDRDRETYPFALPHGSILAGRYITGRILGQGGFGITYLAQDYKTQGLVAIKEFFPESLAARSDGHTVSAYSGERGESFQYGKECFLTEARTLAEFKGSENIVNIHGYFEENGTAYFVMDFVEGISFQQYLRDRGGRIGWREAVDIMVPVMRALAAVHSRNIIHRDVTPDNIFITDTGTVKLLDFGAARYSVGDRSQSLDVVLKHGFAPKEQYVRRGKQGAYTDVYSAAATLYYAVTGRIPPDSIERADDDSIIAPSALGVSIPRNIEDAIFKGLEVQPPDRFQNMGDFIAALTESSGRDDEVEDNGGADDAEEDTDADPRERRGKKLPVWSYAAAAAARRRPMAKGTRKRRRMP